MPQTAGEDRRGKSHKTESEEYVPEDDAVIGRAFRWSLLVILLLGAIGGAAVFISWPDDPVDETRMIETPAPARLETASGIPSIQFTDITREAGIDFVHSNGARGGKFLPETMGGGVAFLDYDGDGDQDLLFVNSDEWPWSRPDGVRHRMALYSNDGTGRFENVTSEAGLDLNFYGMGVAVGDFDNDGDSDLFISALGPNRLLENRGGRFVDISQSAGVAGADNEWSSSAGFFDYDGDGYLDLFVCNYVRWSREIDLELDFTLNGKDRAYGPPNNFSGTHPYLYRNNGDGTFTDVSAQAGIQVLNPDTGQAMSKSLALLLIDLDGDSHMDVIIANDTVRNTLYHNQGDGTFQEIGVEAGLAYDFDGNATGAMGIDGGFYRNDSNIGISIANFANEMSSLYVSQDEPLWFVDESIGEGIGSPSRLRLSFGLFFFDYDLDGRIDLLQSNGHLEEEINQVQPSQHYEQPPQLFWNRGTHNESCFAEVPAETLGDLASPLVGRGAAYADIDGDGDLDMVLTQVGRPPLLLRNDQATGHRWLRVKLRGTVSNRDAIGAWVELTAGGVTQRRPVMPTRSYLSQVELPVTFGLGDADRVDSLRVTWPDGSRQEVAVPGLNRTLEVVQPRP